MCYTCLLYTSPGLGRRAGGRPDRDRVQDPQAADPEPPAHLPGAGHLRDRVGRAVFLRLQRHRHGAYPQSDVYKRQGYNNMAIGMYAGRDGNKLYCPTGYKELLRLQDRFVFPVSYTHLDVYKRQVQQKLK